MVNLGCFYRVWKMAMVISIRLPLMPGIPKPTTAGYVDCSDDMSHDSNLRFFLEESRRQLDRALGFDSRNLLGDCFLGFSRGCHRFLEGCKEGINLLLPPPLFGGLYATSKEGRGGKGWVRTVRYGG